MTTCRCKTSAIVIGGLFIFAGIVMTIGYLVFLIFESPHMEYYTLVNIFSGWQSKPFAVDSRVFYIAGALVFSGMSVFMIHILCRRISQYILFNEESVIFVLSKTKKYEYKWDNLQQNVEMRWKPLMQGCVLQITFLKKQEIVSKRMMVSKNVKIKKENTFLLPSNYKGYVEFIGYAWWVIRPWNGIGIWRK